MVDIPEIRLRTANQGQVRYDGDYVLYWMVAFRRVRWNYSLQRAVEWARDLKKPLLVLEALRSGYRWASDRIHHFVIQGMADNARALRDRPVTYFPYLEPEPGAGKGLLNRLAERACIVISDDYPCFFLPQLAKVAARQLDVRFELVDSNGILPMRAADRVFSRAFDFRRFLQKNLPPHLTVLPEPDPLEGVKLPRLGQVPLEVRRRWPPINPEEFVQGKRSVAELPLDHSVLVTRVPGGSVAAKHVLNEFLESKLDRYVSERNQPERDVTSGLSPFLHFGHMSVHEVFHEVVCRDGWSVRQLSDKVTGSSTGWWSVSAEVESFLDELITWREIGFNMCWQRRDYHRYESLPDWAQRTLAQHADDPREHVYCQEEFEGATTHDELWNAAQRQLVREGRIHNYLRMLWGKKILEWSASPRDALRVMIELNNKYALDGRDPNSYSGIFWVLGRYDRAWGPERPIFGKIRYMSSDNTRRKLRVKQYIRQYGPPGDQGVRDQQGE